MRGHIVQGQRSLSPVTFSYCWIPLYLGDVLRGQEGSMSVCRSAQEHVCLSLDDLAHLATPPAPAHTVQLTDA